MTTESPAPTLPDHEIPTISLDELRHLQTERLRATISAAYANVGHYKAAFDAKGVTPDDIQALEREISGVAPAWYAGCESNSTSGMVSSCSKAGTSPPLASKSALSPPLKLPSNVPEDS